MSAIAGEYNDQQVLLELVQATEQLKDRKERGVGKQNFYYGPALREVFSKAATMCPQVYNLLSQHFSLPSMRGTK